MKNELADLLNCIDETLEEVLEPENLLEEEPEESKVSTIPAKKVDQLFEVAFPDVTERKVVDLFKLADESAPDNS